MKARTIKVLALAAMIGVAYRGASFVRAEAPETSATQLRYQVVDLGVLPDCAFSTAVAINEQGQVLGTCGLNAYQAETRMFLWESGKRREILPPSTLPDYPRVHPTALNDSGQVVGSVWSADNWHRRAFFWEPGDAPARALSASAENAPGEEISQAYSINNRGQVAGYTYQSSVHADGQRRAERQHAFLWNPKSGAQELIGADGQHPFDGLYAPVLVNDAEQVVSISWELGRKNEKQEAEAGRHAHSMIEGISPSQAFLWKQGQVTPVAVPGAWVCESAVQNQRGDIAMRVRPFADSPTGRLPQPERIALWKQGRAVYLGSAENQSLLPPLAMNDKDEIVSAIALPPSVREQAVRIVYGSGAAPAPEHRAVLFSEGKRYILNDLIPSDSRWILRDACGINSRGEIVGNGLHDGKRRAFLLIPVNR